MSPWQGRVNPWRLAASLDSHHLVVKQTQERLSICLCPSSVHRNHTIIMPNVVGLRAGVGHAPTEPPPHIPEPLHQPARTGNSHNKCWNPSALRGELPDSFGRFGLPYERLLRHADNFVWYRWMVGAGQRVTCRTTPRKVAHRRPVG